MFLFSLCFVIREEVRRRRLYKHGIVTKAQVAFAGEVRRKNREGGIEYAWVVILVYEVDGSEYRIQIAMKSFLDDNRLWILYDEHNSRNSMRWAAFQHRNGNVFGGGDSLLAILERDAPIQD